MALGKNKARIRLNSGNNFQIKFGSPSAWKNLGEIISGKLEDITDSTTITFADGSTYDVDTTRKVKLSIVLAQTSKEELELVDVLRDGTFPAYYYNGIVDNKHQEFFFPEVNIVSKLDLDMKGATHQTITLELSVSKQADLAECTPDTDLPADAYASGNTPVEGKNNYYVILETAA